MSLTPAAQRAVPVYLNAMGVVCALGQNAAAVRTALHAPQPGGIAPNTSLWPEHALLVGQVPGELHPDTDLPPQHRSRNNRLLLTAWAQIRHDVQTAIHRHGRARVGVVLGTSTSGIGEGAHAIAQQHHLGQLPPEFHMAQQELGSPALALADFLGLTGPQLVISTACSSSAKAMASAARLLQAGLCDAVLTGGVDALCSFTVAGFSALDSVSSARCNPFSRNRQGINIGEGGALFLMSRAPGPVRLLGWGESSDAYHLSAPAPDGRGALQAMQAALQRAELPASALDYINLHGTATAHNDAMESLAVQALLGEHAPQPWASSTKALTGHTLGGAGALEAALCWLSLHDNAEGWLPPHWWDGEPDPALPALRLVPPGTRLGRPLRHVLSNSFAFGGSNASLLLGSA